MNQADTRFAEMHRAAMEAAIVALVRALHDKGVLDIDEYITVLESTAGFARAAFNQPKNPVLDVMLNHFKEMSEAFKLRDT